MTIKRGPPRPDLYHPDLVIPERYKRTPGDRDKKPAGGALPPPDPAEAVAREAKAARAKGLAKRRKKDKARAAGREDKKRQEAKLAAARTVHKS